MTYLPTTLPTATQVAEIARSIASAETRVHRQTVADLATITTEAGLYPGAVDVLRTSDPSSVLYHRALATIARNWQTIASHARTADFDRALANLLTQWRSHQELRNGQDLAQLWDSHEALVQARETVAAARSRC